MDRETFLQQCVLAQAARRENFDGKLAVAHAIEAFEFIKRNVLSNSREFQSAPKLHGTGGK